MAETQDSATAAEATGPTYPQTFVNVNGDERIVNSLEGGYRANADGFYGPDSLEVARFKENASKAETEAAKASTTVTRAQLDEQALALGYTEDEVKAFPNKAAVQAAIDERS